MGQSCSYVPLSQSKRQMSDSVIGDGPFFVCKLLDKMSRSSTDCARAIEDVYTSLNPKEVSGAGKKRDTAKDEERSVLFYFCIKTFNLGFWQNKKVDWGIKYLLLCI